MAILGICNLFVFLGWISNRIEVHHKSLFIQIASGLDSNFECTKRSLDVGDLKFN